MINDTLRTHSYASLRTIEHRATHGKAIACWYVLLLLLLDVEEWYQIDYRKVQRSEGKITLFVGAECRNRGQMNVIGIQANANYGIEHVWLRRKLYNKGSINSNRF